jgi:DNA-binding CsgD family transcriptional regulator
MELLGLLLSHQGAAPLSRLEQEVTALVIQNLTSAQIAQRLSISPGSVDALVLRVRTKLSGGPPRSIPTRSIRPFSWWSKASMRACPGRRRHPRPGHDPHPTTPN